MPLHFEGSTNYSGIGIIGGNGYTPLEARFATLAFRFVFFFDALHGIGDIDIAFSVYAFFEVAHAFAQAFAELGKFLGAEHDDHDQGYDQPMSY
jgi:hypothetical protein